MRTPLFQLQHILDAFQRNKVLTKSELLAKTGCSSMTSWRLLHQYGYLTSYNDNARHYTLAGIPKFDQHGLWAYRNVRFSKWGSLTKTIVGLVQESSAGLTAEQLQQLLHLRNVKPILTRLIDRKALTREKTGGRFVYFSTQQKVQSKQHQQRQSSLEMTHTRPIQSERPLADWLGGMNTMQKLGLLQVPVISDVAGFVGDLQQYRDEPESRGLLNYSLTGLGLLPFMPNMTVFHGSPHKWLPEEGFSMGRPRLDKIGTGEGAQAYGHGMYFAESPGVARSYANQNKGSAFLARRGIAVGDRYFDSRNGLKDARDAATDKVERAMYDILAMAQARGIDGPVKLANQIKQKPVLWGAWDYGQDTLDAAMKRIRKENAGRLQEACPRESGCCGGCSRGS